MRFNKVLILLSLMAIISTASATRVFIDTDVAKDDDVYFDGEPFISYTLITPDDGGVYYHDESIPFNVDVNVTYVTKNATLYVYYTQNESIALTYLNTTEYNGTKYLGTHTLNTNNYSFSIYACQTPEVCAGGCGPEDIHCTWSNNYTLQTITRIPDVIEGGECLTIQGYSFQWTAAADEDYTQLNLSTTGLIHSNLMNMNTTMQAWYHSPYTMVLNTSVIKAGLVYLGSSSINNTFPGSPPSEDLSLDVGLSNLTLHQKYYHIIMLNETSGEAYPPQYPDVHSLTLYCLEYSPSTIDLKGRNLSDFYIAAYERPVIDSLVDYTQHRKIQPVADTGLLRFYHLDNTTNMSTWNIKLEDYSNDFRDSYLRIQRNINDSIKDVWYQQWVNHWVTDIMLEDNIYYKLQVWKADDFRDISWYQVLNDSNKTIYITEPYMRAPLDHMENLTTSFTEDYDNEQVGWSYAALSGVVEASGFTVYLYNASGYTELYTSTANTSQAGSYGYAVPNINDTYLIKTSITHNVYGSVDEKKIIKLVNRTTGTRYVDLNVPAAGFFNYDETWIYNIISSIIIITAGLLFSSASAGVGSVVFAGTTGFLYYIQWLNIPWIMAASLSVFLILNFLVFGRRDE